MCDGGFSKTSIKLGAIMRTDNKTYGSLLHDDVFYVEIFNIDVLGISVGFGIFQQTDNEFDGFFRPAT